MGQEHVLFEDGRLLCYDKKAPTPVMRYIDYVKALQHAKSIGADICGIVGRDGGYTAKVADACIVIPTVNPETITPHSEAFQAVIWHLLVSHPSLKAVGTKWESMR